MDQSVIAALARWPDVPAVFGWLALTARGEWRLRGDPIGNSAIREFIGRNYADDERGRWFFQNGPQRVFVELETTPIVYRSTAAGTVVAHTGITPARCSGVALIDGATLLLVTDLGAGMIDDRDAATVIDIISTADGVALEPWLTGGCEAQFVPSRLGMAGAPLTIGRMTSADLSATFGYTRKPQP